MLTSIWITVIAKALLGFLVVKIQPTSLAFSIRKQLVVNFSVMLAHPSLRRQLFFYTQDTSP